MDESRIDDIKELMANNKEVDIDLVERAYQFAKYIHNGKTRSYEDKPYLVHPVRVCRYLAERLGETDGVVLAISLLHDVLEESVSHKYNETEAKILETFGDEVCRGVLALTKKPATGEEKYKIRYEFNCNLNKLEP